MFAENYFGVMQGRLLPKYKGRYQAHPLNYWQDEFRIANEIGLDCIEFILDYEDCDLNPLLNSQGIEEIKILSEANNIEVKSICADYFMEAPLHNIDSKLAKNSADILKKLLENSTLLGVENIVIPLVDQSSINSSQKEELFVKRIREIIDSLGDFEINLSLETDLPPDNFAKLLKNIDSKKIKVNYDIGNSASLGYDPVEELSAYGSEISDIHIKDRVLNGGPVKLGEGNANFDKFFLELEKYHYSGPFIMQAFRDDEGVAIFKDQMNWIRSRYFL